jgi:hypothetical protein
MEQENKEVKVKLSPKPQALNIYYKCCESLSFLAFEEKKFSF